MMNFTFMAGLKQKGECHENYNVGKSICCDNHPYNPVSSNTAIEIPKL